jgi:peptide/nickel transport system substrate-binding protein
VVEDDAVALNMLKAGELDEMRCTQGQWEKQMNEPDFERRFRKVDYYFPGYNFIAWNCKSEWFSDRRVRKAMTLLFDRESVNTKIYSGYARLVSGPFYINSWAYDKTVKPLPFDPAAARAMLDEAGWTDANGTAFATATASFRVRNEHRERATPPASSRSCSRRSASRRESR